MIGRLVIAPDIELSLAFAVVGTDDDDGLIEYAETVKFVDHPPDMLVGISDARVVTVNPLSNGVHGVDRGGEAREAKKELLAAVAVRLPG